MLPAFSEAFGWHPRDLMDLTEQERVTYLMWLENRGNSGG